ncbi:MAG: hypothetical protein ABIW18_00550 [Sphingomicrobium sp.]
MIYKRAMAKLRAQEWTAITIELFIVILGVFIGTLVANWNQGRLDRQATDRMLEQLRPEIQNQFDFFESARTYYRATKPFSDQALAGWAGDPRVSDNQFVIAAYQASQIYGIGINAQNWALTFGGTEMRDISDPRVRKNLAVVLTADYDPVGFGAVATPCREHVRQIIPNSVQDAIRASCGDRNVAREGTQYLVVLPAACPLQLDPAEAAKAAAALRAHPELVRELNWHLAAVANYLTNIDGLEGAFRALDDSLKKRSGN